MVSTRGIGVILLSPSIENEEEYSKYIGKGGIIIYYSIRPFFDSNGTDLILLLVHHLSSLL
jgi:hypothetical protein